MPLTKRIPRRIVFYLLIFGCYFVIVILLTWPLTNHLTTHLPDGTDTLLHYWNGWWIAKAFSDGLNPFFTNYMFYPIGISVVYNNFAWLSIGGWLILKPILGNIAAYNIVFMINLALCGLSAYWLAVEIIKNRRVAFIAGVIYLAWPYRLSQPSHPNLMSTWMIPVFILFLYRVIRNNRFQDSVFAGLAFALVGYTRWQLLVPALIVGSILTLILIAMDNEINVRRTILNLSVSMFIALILLLPPIILLMTELNKNPAELILENELLYMQTDLLAYITPASLHPIFGKFTQPLYESFYLGRGSRSNISPYVGFVPIVLVLIGLWKSQRKDTLPLLGPAVVLILLALGPVLRINGQLYQNIPMPYSLANKVPFVGIMREPERFNMFLALPISMLAAYGMAQIVSQRNNSFRQVGILTGIFLLILLEYIIAPMPIQSALASPAILELARENNDSAVLNIPVNPFKSKPYMFAQTIHGRAILQGHTSRYPENAFSFLESQPYLNSLMMFDEIPPKERFVSQQLELLSRQGIDHIIIDKHQISSEFLEKWRYHLAIKPLLEDDDVLIYRTRPIVNQDYKLKYLLSPGIGIIDLTVSDCSVPGEVVAINLIWGTTETLNDTFTVRFHIRDNTGKIWQTKFFKVRSNEESEWSSTSIIHDSYSWVLPTELPPGDYLITASLNDAPSIVINNLQVAEGKCEFIVPANMTLANLQFNDSIRLLAYDVEKINEELLITLCWLPIKSISANYKNFVHVFDPETKIPVAQHDSMPQNWSYPTSYWGLNEQICETIVISLSQIPAGDYGLAVGLYDPVTGDRMVVRDNSGQTLQDGRFILPTMIKIP